MELARRLISCEVLGEPVPEKPLCGMTQQQIRKASHFPQEVYGQPHFMPEFADSEQILWLNRLRCSVRNAELAAARAFTDGEGKCLRSDILQVLNRMSSMVYILMIQRKQKDNRNRQ